MNEAMTFKEFEQKLLKELQERFPQGTKLTIQTFRRNNQVEVKGLAILEPGKTTSQAIHLLFYYQKWIEGIPFSEILDMIQREYQKNQMEDIDISFYTDFESVEPRIIYRLIHFERNRKLLEGIPYVRFLDLAVVFYYMLEIEESGNSAIQITNSHLKRWGRTAEELYCCAQENTSVLYPFYFADLYDVLKGYLSLEMEPNEDYVGMFLLSNNHNFQGAACILYQGLLGDLAERLDADLYIIPSSIHEVLLVPAREGTKEADFDKMIREVNESQLAPEEILSDHVYYFSREKNRILE